MVHKYNPLSIAFPCGQRPKGSCSSVADDSPREGKHKL